MPPAAQYENGTAASEPARRTSRRGGDLDGKQIERLADAARAARKHLQKFRVERYHMLAQYAGSHYSENASATRVPVNFFSLYLQVVGRLLVSKNPRVLLSTFHRGSRHLVDAMQNWANRQIEKQYLYNTFQRAVYDALFSVGIVKVAISTPADSAMKGFYEAAGSPCVGIVDLDDFVFDNHTRSFETASFLGHRYRAPYRVVKDWKEYRAAGRKALVVQEQLPEYNAEGDPRSWQIGRGTASDDTEFEDHVELWEFYLPRHRAVVTLPADEDGSPNGEHPLLVQDWIGPPCGPYHFLGFQPVPGAAMPKGPLSDLLDLHESANEQWKKLRNQAHRTKVLTVVGRAAAEEAERWRDAKDGEVLPVSNPDMIKDGSTGGPHAGLFQFFLATKELFDFFSGNISILGGLSPQSKTATQDRMLNENSSRLLSDMQETTVAFISKVLNSLSWFWWHDPSLDMTTSYNPPSAPEVSITRTVTPLDRLRADWEMVDLRVDPYSLVHQTPAMRMTALQGVVTQVVMPLLPLLQQQGVMFDMPAFLKKMAEYMDMPDLTEILSIGNPVMPGGGGDGGGDAPGMPAETTRNYVRESVSGRTEEGNNMVLQNALLGVDSGGAPGSGSAWE